MINVRSIIVLSTVILLLASCNQQVTEQENQQTLEPTINYEGVSLVVMEEAKKTLGGELKAAMERGGVEEAINYCNLHALAITDSVGKRYTATIKRVTDKPRNPENAANTEELAQIAHWRKLIEAGENKVVTSEETDEVRNFYIPIKIDALCLNCHGVAGESLAIENRDIILGKYPNDKATGYQLGDLRGLWHISFNK